MELIGKNVFIIGSICGIGKVVVLVFVKEGVNIVLNGWSEIMLE